MQLLRQLKRTLVTLAVPLLAAGCADRERTVTETTTTSAYNAGPQVVVDEPPPPPRVEAATESPGPDYVWIGGGWVWQGHWHWDQGHWEQPPHTGAVWVPGRYVERDGKYYYDRGHWE